MSMSTEYYNFRGQREDEDVLAVIHQHPWALSKTGIVAGVAIAIISLAFYWFKLSSVSIWTVFVVSVIAAAYIGYHWFVWWNNLYILTNQRVIIIVQRNLWSRRIEDYSLHKIQSVASAVTGPFGALLNHGEISMAVIGLGEKVVLPYVEDPRAVQETFLDAIRGTEGEIRINEYDKPRPKKRLIQH